MPLKNTKIRDRMRTSKRKDGREEIGQWEIQNLPKGIKGMLLGMSEKSIRGNIKIPHCVYVKCQTQ